MARYGSEGWAPKVTETPISVVTLDAAATVFSAENVKWSVAEGIGDETPGFVPVLVSANLDCSGLLSTYDGNEDLPLMTSDGKPVTVVRKDGAVETVEPKYLNARYLYHHRAFSDGPKSYLTPKGRVWVRVYGKVKTPLSRIFAKGMGTAMKKVAPEGTARARSPAGTPPGRAACAFSGALI